MAALEKAKNVEKDQQSVANGSIFPKHKTHRRPLKVRYNIYECIAAPCLKVELHKQYSHIVKFQFYNSQKKIYQEDSKPKVSILLDLTNQWLEDKMNYHIC